MDEVKLDRIKRLIKDLEYECASGLHQNQIDEQLEARHYIGHFDKEFPAWRLTVKFEPVHKYDMALFSEEQYKGLQLVVGGKKEERKPK